MSNPDELDILRDNSGRMSPARYTTYYSDLDKDYGANKEAELEEMESRNFDYQHPSNTNPNGSPQRSPQSSIQVDPLVEEGKSAEKPSERPIRKRVDYYVDEKPMPNYGDGTFGTFLKFVDAKMEISRRGSTYGRELLSGLTTFISMVYILTVNPNILSSAKPTIWDSVFIATCLASFISCCIMAFVPNVPFALSCGLGLNAQVMLYTLGVGVPVYSFGGAMCVVFISGIVFLLVTLVGFREYIFDSIPPTIKSAIPCGIGLFIAHIGLQDASIVVGSETLVSFVTIHEMYLDPASREKAFQALVCFIGVLSICILDHFRVKGCVFIGIAISAIIGIAFGVTPVENITKGWNVGERFKNFFSFDEDQGGSFGLCFPGFKNAFSPGSKVPTTIVLVISYGVVDLFDTLGTLYGLGVQANLLDENGKCYNYSKCLFADCIGAVFGSIFGCSSVTTYLESSTGIAVGARTGLTTFTVGMLFLLSMFLSPIFFMIPLCATAPALIYVGVEMMATVIYIDFSNIIDAIPVFLTIVMMPLTYSTTNGMCIGIVTYTVVHILSFLFDCLTYLCVGKVYPRPQKTTVDEEVKVDDPEEEKEKEAEEKSERPKWPINLGLGVITILFALTIFLPTKFTSD